MKLGGPDRCLRDRPASPLRREAAQGRAQDRRARLQLRWSAEAAAIPALDTRFYKDAKENARRSADECRRGPEAGPRAEARFQRPLSIRCTGRLQGKRRACYRFRASIGTFDRRRAPQHQLRRNAVGSPSETDQISISTLFSRPVAFAATDAMALIARALDAERLKAARRREAGPARIQRNARNIRTSRSRPSTATRTGASTRIDFIASPYVAGPYVEGEYEILRCRLRRELIAALKPDYRGSFEPQRQ